MRLRLQTVVRYGRGHQPDVKLEPVGWVPLRDLLPFHPKLLFPTWQNPSSNLFSILLSIGYRSDVSVGEGQTSSAWLRRCRSHEVMAYEDAHLSWLDIYSTYVGQDLRSGLMNLNLVWFESDHLLGWLMYQSRLIMSLSLSLSSFLNSFLDFILYCKTRILSHHLELTQDFFFQKKNAVTFEPFRFEPFLKSL